MPLPSYTQLLKGRKWLLISGLLIILLLLRRMQAKANNHKAEQPNRDIILQSKYSAYADYIIAQAKHESANFTSRVYRLNNNPFGMKVPRIRPFLGSTGTQAPDGGFYAKYPNDSVAFQDLIGWLQYNRIPTNLVTARDYVKAIHRKKYFTGDLEQYIKAVERWMKAK